MIPNKARQSYCNFSLLISEIFPHIKFYVNISYSFRVMSLTNLKVIKMNRGNSSIIRQGRVMVLLYCTTYPRSIYLQNFMLIYLIVLKLCSEQNSNYKNEQRPITPILGKAETVLFHCTSIYLFIKCHVDISCSL
jgi:hypothetical protein